MAKNKISFDDTDNPSVCFMEIKVPSSREVMIIKFDYTDLIRVSSEYWRMLSTGRIVNSTNTISLHYFIYNVSRSSHLIEFKTDKNINFCRANLILIQRNTYIIDPTKEYIYIEVRSNLKDNNNPKIITIDRNDYEKVNKYVWHVYNGYACTNPGTEKERDKWRMQRLIMADALENKPDMVVDHINFDRLNNCKSNLQVVTNNYNSCKRNPVKDVNDLSKRTGVYRNEIKGRPPRWVAIYRCPDTGITRQKYFSVNLYGEEEAKKLATEFRDKYPIY